MNGWIKIERAITEHWIYDDPWKFRAWIDLLVLANHAEHKVNLKNQIYVCGRGEVLRSLDFFSRRWRENRSKIRSFLLLLQKDNMIELKTGSKITHITICKYESYQGEPNADETQMKRNRNEDETQPKTYKNVKNVNNVKNIFSAPEFKQSLIDLGVDEKLAEDVIQHRRKCKGLFTERAFSGLKKQLELFEQAEKTNLAAALTFLVEETSWQTFTYEYYKNKKHGKQQTKHVASVHDYGQIHGAAQF